MLSAKKDAELVKQAKANGVSGCVVTLLLAGFMSPLSLDCQSMHLIGSSAEPCSTTDPSIFEVWNFTSNLYNFMCVLDNISFVCAVVHAAGFFSSARKGCFGNIGLGPGSEGGNKARIALTMSNEALTSHEQALTRHYQALTTRIRVRKGSP